MSLFFLRLKFLLQNAIAFGSIFVKICTIIFRFGEHFVKVYICTSFGVAFSIFQVLITRSIVYDHGFTWEKRGYEQPVILSPTQIDRGQCRW